MAAIVYQLFNVYLIGLIVYAVASWIQHPQARALHDWLGRFYEPVLAPIRQILHPKRFGESRAAFDFAPLVLFLVVVLVRNVLVGVLGGPR
ncbi:MAG TPA: YggT family protein [Thioalkalivibrio sp.]|nr:YggT family protein [Thioalkalivibrio sp.]